MIQIEDNVNAFQQSFLGPVDPSVLRLSSRHRSELIWRDDNGLNLRFRRSDHNIWIKFLCDIRVQRLLYRMGLYGVYIAITFQTDHALISAIVERRRQETHTFHLLVSKTTLHYRMLRSFGGYPLLGILSSLTRVCKLYYSGRTCATICWDSDFYMITLVRTA